MAEFEKETSLDSVNQEGGQSLIDLLVVVICTSDQVNKFTQELVKSRFSFTRIDSSGGLLSTATISLLVGINRKRAGSLMEILKNCCRTHMEYIPAQIDSPLVPGQPLMIEAELGGALAYTIEVDHFEQI
jgi:uncharacterized protein YaaQ